MFGFFLLKLETLYLRVIVEEILLFFDLVYLSIFGRYCVEFMTKGNSDVWLFSTIT